jgi:sialate O-acetylesterase
MIASIALALGLLAGVPADDGQAKPFLHPLFTDHAVLQRDVPLPVWGWTEPGQRVKVDFAGQSVETTANDQGRWQVKIGPYPAGGPYVLTVKGPKSAEVKDILIGDVWICSGQSNMEWSVVASNNAREEIASANYPRLRHITIPKKIALEPQSTFEGSWQTCTPETVGLFTAVGYFFGRELNRELNVPIGLIHSSWGGTICEAWASAGALQPMKDFDSALAQIQSDKADAGKPPVKFEQVMAAWWKKSDPGSNEQPSWSDPNYDSTAWKSMTLPGHWEGKGLPEFDGIVWFRKDVMVPESWDGKEAAISLGPIDDRDTTFINGVEIGQSNTWLAPRNYKIAAGILKPGRNVIAVRALDTSGPGGFFGGEKDMKLTVKEVDQAEPISLAGEWSYKASTPLGELSSVPEPESTNPNRVTVLYNGMIAPLKPFPIKGAIWYQGESNAGRPAQYRTLLPTMIQDWRAAFEVGDFPFYIVQLANYMEVRKEPVNSMWAELRESQFLATRALPNVGIALAIDIGEARDIHPRNKQEVGRRLALSALAGAYGQDIEFSGPVYKAKELKGNTIRLTFDHIGGGLAAKGSEKLEGFAIAGEDGKYVWADAVIDGDAVVVSSPKVEKPVNVRYAWADNPVCNLYNQVGLPAVPFRTDAP